MNLDVTWSWGRPASPAPGSTAPARRGKSRLSVQAPATSWADGVPTERGLPGLMLPKHVRQSCSQGFALKRPKRLGGGSRSRGGSEQDLGRVPFEPLAWVCLLSPRRQWVPGAGGR